MHEGSTWNLVAVLQVSDMTTSIDTPRAWSWSMIVDTAPWYLRPHSCTHRLPVLSAIRDHYRAEDAGGNEKCIATLSCGLTVSAHGNHLAVTKPSNTWGRGALAAVDGTAQDADVLRVQQRHLPAVVQVLPCGRPQQLRQICLKRKIGPSRVELR